MKKRPVVANLRYAGAYRASLEEAEKTGQCVFCKPEFQENPLLIHKDWFVRNNQYPTKDVDGKNPERHLLIVSRRHRDNDQLMPADWRKIGEILRILQKDFGLAGYGLGARLGDFIQSGRTVLHAHVHVIAPFMVDDPRNPGRKKPVPVYFPFG